MLALIIAILCIVAIIFSLWLIGYCFMTKEDYKQLNKKAKRIYRVHQARKAEKKQRNNAAKISLTVPLFRAWITTSPISPFICFGICLSFLFPYPFEFFHSHSPLLVGEAVGVGDVHLCHRQRTVFDTTYMPLNRALGDATGKCTSESRPTPPNGTNAPTPSASNGSLDCRPKTYEPPEDL
ncbi:MAG: hypothetical protein IJU35_05930 [Paludibacteraceae bacterium]|nr:hypothetical protein [Paludibacteraceae bacterium]